MKRTTKLTPESFVQSFFASDILPVIQLSTRWDEILFQALKEVEE